VKYLLYRSRACSNRATADCAALTLKGVAMDRIELSTHGHAPRDIYPFIYTAKENTS